MQNQKKKLLYCIHVDWSWIKQRPHFIAESLNQFYQIDVLCKRVWNAERNNNPTNINICFPFRFPFERFKIVNWINICIRHIYLRSIIKRYDFLWFTAPTEDCNFLLSKVDKKVKVVYDCMDDYLEFPINAHKINTVIELEKKLYNRSNLIICTSNYLKEKLLKRYGPKRIVVVNNALAINNNIDKIETIPSNVSPLLDSPKIKMVYIGTISEWFDVELCKSIITTFSNVELFLFGPCESCVESKLNFPGVNLCGTVEHKYVNTIMDSSDILIMPFIINELILSVNPVKLYEYIKSGKPCVAPRYGESEPFGDYVYLYNDNNDCINIIGSLIFGNRGSKMSKEKCQKYAEQNTWEKRVDVIVKELNNI